MIFPQKSRDPNKKLTEVFFFCYSMTDQTVISYERKKISVCFFRLSRRFLCQSFRPGPALSLTRSKGQARPWFCFILIRDIFITLMGLLPHSHVPILRLLWTGPAIGNRLSPN